MELLTSGRVPHVRVSDPLAFYEQFVENRRPAIVVGCVQWPKTAGWSLRSFDRRFGNRSVRVGGKPTTMGAFIERLRASTPEDPAPYLNGVSIARDFPELMAEVSPPPLITQPNWLTSSRMPERWGTRDGYAELLIGGRGTHFPSLHYDQYCLHTAVTQIVGEKDFYLFAPDDAPLLYPNPDYPNRSLIEDIHRPDLERWPMFAGARPIHVRLLEGDTIFVPWGWWHTTHLPDTSIAVSYNMANDSNWQVFSHDFGSRNHPAKQAAVKLILQRVATYERRHASAL